MKLEQYQIKLNSILCNTIFEYYKGLECSYKDISVEKLSHKTIITISDNIMHKTYFKIVLSKSLNDTEPELLVIIKKDNEFVDITDTREGNKLFYLFVSNNIKKFGMNDIMIKR